MLTVKAMYIKYIILLFFIFTVLNCKNILASSEKNDTIVNLKMGIYQHSLVHYSQYLTGNICEKLINNNNVRHLHRNIIELTIMCLAFDQQGIKLKIETVLYPNLVKGITMVENGTVDTLQVSVWEEDINENKLYKSAAILRKNEYEKGIYVYEKHPLLNQSTKNLDLTPYIGITKKIWRYDWQAINQLSNKVADVNHMPSLIEMLSKGRADFTLHDFSSHPDFIPLEGYIIKLKPILGVKVVFPASRHFIVARKWKLAALFIDILDQGIKKLREQEKITQLYYQGGFINQRTKNWRVLNKRVGQ